MPRHTMTSVLAAMAMIVAATMATPSRAQTYKAIDAEALIKRCWDVSLEKRSQPATPKIHEGILDSVLCLEADVKGLGNILFEKNSIGANELVKNIEYVREGIQRIYWSLYNGHRGCDLSCGTMYHTFHLSANAEVLEKIIRDMAKQINEYKLTSPKER